MKKIKKILILLVFTTTFIIANNCYSFADPGSSKGFADYDDTKAEQESEKVLEEQNKNFDSEKSTNNYLEDLQVEGYKLSPEFDKQTLEYTINEEITSDKISIKATASDSKATIEGIGNVKIEENQNQCRIDVTSESGTVRTYIIKFKKAETVEKNEEENNQIAQNTVDENQEITNQENIQENVENKQNNKKQDNKILYGALLVVLIIVILCIIKAIASKK